jgi:hypothetical protein
LLSQVIHLGLRLVVCLVVVQVHVLVWTLVQALEELAQVQVLPPPPALYQVALICPWILPTQSSGHSHLQMMQHLVFCRFQWQDLAVTQLLQLLLTLIRLLQLLRSRKLSQRRKAMALQKQKLKDHPWSPSVVCVKQGNLLQCPLATTLIHQLLHLHLHL